MAASGSDSGRQLIASLVDDLVAESGELRAVLEPRSASDWTRPTPAAGWTIVDQVTHLAYFDDVTLLSITDPDQFRRDADALASDGDDYPDRVAAAHRHLDGDALRTWFRASRQGLLDAYARCDPATRLPWFGPDMGVASSVTARIMETWAHGQDIADTLGVRPEPTPRLRHIAHLGVRTLAFSFQLRGRPVPKLPVRVVLAAPGRDAWSWGPPEATDTVRGPALDFCLVVTQRRHAADTALELTGPVATEWMTIAQAFAGPPGPGRPPGRFSGARHA